MGRRLASSTKASVIAALVATSAPSAARADSYITGYLFGLGVSTPLAAIGVGAALTVGLSHGDEGRPALGARVFGLGAGALNIGWGAFMAYLGTTVSDNQGIYFGFAALNVAVGAADVALTLYRASRPPRATLASRVFVVPLGGVDARGQPFGAVALRVLCF